MLTVPYVLLVVLTASVVGFLSYRAGSVAVDTLSDLVLNESVDRIAQAVDMHVSGSEAVLETAFPADVPAPASIEADIDRLRERLWLATSIHRDPNNYAYYGDRRGRFIGLWRHSETEAELRLKTGSAPRRTVYRFSRITGPLRDPLVETRVFDPRERPWFEAGRRNDRQTWTSVYIDFRTLELVSTRARRVDGADGEFEGVVATDMSLQHLNDFLKTLRLSEHGVAFIVERDGNMIATSRGPHLRKSVSAGGERLDAAESEDPLIAATFAAVEGFLADAAFVGAASGGEARTGAFEGPDGGTVQAGFVKLQDAAGLDWIVAVAAPRQDFMHKVTHNAQRTAMVAAIACALIVFVGLRVLNRVAGDLAQLTHATRRMGEGELDARLPVERPDEIGALAKAFAQLQERLLTDRLTGIANREAMVRRLEDRVIRHRRSRDHRPFALLFIDLDGFKAINDRFGHDIGDQVLAEVSRRLGDGVRERDLVARFGGDEFVLLLDEVANRDDALRVVGHLKAALARPYDVIREISDEAIRYADGASIGLALYPEDGQDVQTLLKRADTTMYATKGRSRTPVV